MPDTLCVNRISGYPTHQSGSSSRARGPGSPDPSPWQWLPIRFRSVCGAPMTLAKEFHGNGAEFFGMLTNVCE